MYPEVIRAFERNLESTCRLVTRKDTQRARRKADDKETFDRNLHLACEVQAFDRTVEFIARRFHTTNLDHIRAVVRRSGLLKRATLH